MAAQLGQHWVEQMVGCWDGRLAASMVASTAVEKVDRWAGCWADCWAVHWVDWLAALLAGLMVAHWDELMDELKVGYSAAKSGWPQAGRLVGQRAALMVAH